MGKKGEALRAAKRQQTTYTFTKEQLHDHDQHVVDEFRERVEADVFRKAQERVDAVFAEKEKELKQVVLDEWEERARTFASDDMQSNFFEYMSCMLSVSVRVLVEKFHWKPLDENGQLTRRLAIIRFTDYVKDEIEKIAGDEMKDIRKYNEETFKLYGIRFGTVEED